MKGSVLSVCLQMVYGENTIIQAFSLHFPLQNPVILNVVAHIILKQLIRERKFNYNREFFTIPFAMVMLLVNTNMVPRLLKKYILLSQRDIVFL